MIYNDKIYNIAITTSFIYNKMLEDGEKILQDDNIIFFCIDTNIFYNNTEEIAIAFCPYNPDIDNIEDGSFVIDNKWIYMNIKTMQMKLSQNGKLIDILHTWDSNCLLNSQDKMNKIKVKNFNDDSYIGRVLLYNKQGDAKLSGVTILDGDINKNADYGALITDKQAKDYVAQETITKDSLLKTDSDLNEDTVTDQNIASAKAVIDALTWKTEVVNEEG